VAGWDEAAVPGDPATALLAGKQGANGDKKNENAMRCPKVFHSFLCQI
jgi:hypothetical protein